MIEIFADGVRSIGLANGVVRIELTRLHQTTAAKTLEPDTVGVLMLPANELRTIAAQLNTTIRQLEERAETLAGHAGDKAGPPQSEVGRDAKSDRAGPGIPFRTYQAS